MKINYKKQVATIFLSLFMATIVILSGCSQAADSSTSSTSAKEITLEGIVLTNGTVFITKSDSNLQLTHELISISLPDKQTAKIGSLAEFVIHSEILESYPMQAQAISLRVLDENPPVIKTPIYTGPKVINHLPEAAHFIDVRTPEEFAQGHIEGAINLPLNDLEALILKEAPDLNDTMMVYCRSGNRSASAAKLLKQLNYSIVFDLGGINAYQGELVTETP